MSDRSFDDSSLSRRVWLGGVAVAALCRGSRGDETAPASRPDADLVQALRLKAEAAGLKDITSGISLHYVGVGNSSASFRTEALELCESLAASVLKHFEFKGFDVKPPKHRLGVVVLSDRASYEAFKGDKAQETEGGYYERDSNTLVMFDFLHEPRKGGAEVRRLNTFTLVHEAMHQLTFNIGLLERKGDVPVAISEGFATYAETWRRDRQHLGPVNEFRKAVIKPSGAAKAAEWIEVRDLLTQDAMFEDPDHEQAAYAEAWLLIFELLQGKAGGAKKLQKYLNTLRLRHDPGQRVEDAEEAFGDLELLDRALKTRARLL